MCVSANWIWHFLTFNSRTLHVTFHLCNEYNLARHGSLVWRSCAWKAIFSQRMCVTLGMARGDHQHTEPQSVVPEKSKPDLWNPKWTIATLAFGFASMSSETPCIHTGTEVAQRVQHDTRLRCDTRQRQSKAHQSVHLTNRVN